MRKYPRHSPVPRGGAGGDEGLCGRSPIRHLSIRRGKHVTAANARPRCRWRTLCRRWIRQGHAAARRAKLLARRDFSSRSAFRTFGACRRSFSAVKHAGDRRRKAESLATRRTGAAAFMRQPARHAGLSTTESRIPAPPSNQHSPAPPDRQTIGNANLRIRLRGRRYPPRTAAQ